MAQHLSAQRLRFHGQSSSLGICEPQTPRAELLPQNEVLFDQVLDQRLLSPLASACAHGNQELEWAPRHRRVKIRSISKKFVRRTPLARRSSRRIAFRIYLDPISAPYAVAYGIYRGISRYFDESAVLLAKPPTALVAKRVNRSSVELSFEPAADALSYRVYTACGHPGFDEGQLGL